MEAKPFPSISQQKAGVINLLIKTYGTWNDSGLGSMRYQTSLMLQKLYPTHISRFPRIFSVPPTLATGIQMWVPKRSFVLDQALLFQAGPCPSLFILLFEDCVCFLNSCPRETKSVQCCFTLIGLPFRIQNPSFWAQFQDQSLVPHLRLPSAIQLLKTGGRAWLFYSLLQDLLKSNIQK